MNVRRLVPADARPYRALMLEAYERHPDAFTSSVAERGALPLAWWESRLDPAPTALTVVSGAFEDGHLAGAVGLEFESRIKARHKATLFGMVVAQTHRTRGIGARLVEAAIAEAHARPGVLLVQLTVSEGNRTARSLYERCGFILFSVEPMAIAVGGKFVAKEHMWRDLRIDGTVAVAG